jgi:hypothetical protein
VPGYLLIPQLHQGKPPPKSNATGESFNSPLSHPEFTYKFMDKFLRKWPTFRNEYIHIGGPRETAKDGKPTEIMLSCKKIN